MKRTIFFTISIIGAILFAISCNESSFQGKNNTAKPRPAGSTDSQAQAPGGDGTAGNSNPGEDSAVCPPVNQNLLIIDLKSGWWAGDGGNFFQKMTQEMTTQCGGKIQVEYHHLTRNPMESLGGLMGGMMGGMGSTISAMTDTGFLDQDWGQYTQVWILSGAFNDPLDILPSEETFVKINQKTTAFQGGVFIGAGYGSVMHANALTNGFGMGEMFGTNNAQGDILNVMGGVTIVSRIGRPEKLKDHILFSRGIQSIADIVQVSMQTAKGDYLKGGGGLEVIGIDTDGLSAIAVAKRNNRNMVFDAGLQRFYAIMNNQDPETLIYIQNLIVFLGE